MESRDGDSVPLPRRRQNKIKFMLLLVSLALNTVAFFTFDYFFSAAIQRTHQPAGNPSDCQIRDPVRHHSLKPNCASNASWGMDNYEFFTNSLGFRDEKIREVPLADARPRILMLGDSFTEGRIAWRDSYVGRIAAQFPQYDFLNGGVANYSPSNYLNTTRMVLATGVELDEVIVFIGSGELQFEAAYYRDVDASGAVTNPERQRWNRSWYAKWRGLIARHLLLTNYLVELFERFQVKHGYYHLTVGDFGNLFDSELSAWTYRKVNEKDPYIVGYAPLGVEGGVAKEKAKMTLVWQELEKRNIPISVVVYPYPAQVVHDTVDSRHVRIWRDWCVGKCKRFIPLFPAFLAVKDQCPKFQPGCWYLSHFIFGDVHYNAAGNALVADAVIKSLAGDPPSKIQQQVPAPSTTSSAPQPRFRSPAWCTRFASVFWTLTWLRNVRANPPNIFNSRSRAVHSDSISTTPFSRKIGLATITAEGDEVRPSGFVKPPQTTWHVQNLRPREGRAL